MSPVTDVGCNNTSTPRMHLAAIACVLACLVGSAFASVAQAALPGELETLESSPVQLTSVAADPTSGDIYAQENEGSRFFVYNASGATWTELAAAPTSSGNNGGAAYADGKIYTDYTQNGSVLGVYDIATNSWTTIPNPLGEGTVDITAVGDELYMAVRSSFVEYDTVTEETTPLAAPPAFATGRCIGRELEPWGGLQYYQGKLYADQGNGCNGFAIYDVASNTWTEGQALPLAEGQGAVAGSALDPVAGAYFAQGGYYGHTMFRYEIATAEWTLTELPYSVNDGGMAYVSQPGWRGIYAIQGQEATGFVRYVTREPSADLSLTDTASPASVKVGESLTYTLAVANTGPDEAVNTKLTDALPANVSVESAQTTVGSCSGSSTVTCELGILASGATVTVTITVKATAAGTASDAASVTSETPDPSAANNSAAATATVTSDTRASTPSEPASTPSEPMSKPRKGGPSSPPICKSDRTEEIHWKLGRRVHLATISLTVDGAPFSQLPGNARQTTISFAGRTAGTVTLEIVGVTGSGKRYTGTRVYHVCSGTSERSTLKSLYLLPAPGR